MPKIGAGVKDPDDQFILQKRMTTHRSLSKNCSQPLFVVGAPRSGSTFLLHVLNSHPLVQLTNEARLFVLLKDIISRRCDDQWLLSPLLRRKLKLYLARNIGEFVENFYRNELVIDEPVWGDKYPHYADPEVLGGYGSCLTLIKDILPNAKFIHIHRDPRAVVYSLLKKQWVQNISDAVNVWHRHVEEIADFFSRINEFDYLTVAYDKLRRGEKKVPKTITSFLGIDNPESLEEFLQSQNIRRTPYSDPVSILMTEPVIHLSKSESRFVMKALGSLAKELGYYEDSCAGPRKHEEAINPNDTCIIGSGQGLSDEAAAAEDDCILELEGRLNADAALDWRLDHPLAENHERISELQGQLADSSAWVVELQRESDAKDQRLRELQKELDARGAWNRNLDDELAAKGERIFKLQRELEERLAWVVKLQGEAKAKDKRIAKLQKELDGRGAWNRNLDDELAAKGERIAKLQREVEELSTWAVKLQGEAEAKDQHIAGLQKELDECGAWKRNLNEELARKEERIVELQQELAERSALAVKPISNSIS